MERQAGLDYTRDRLSSSITVRRRVQKGRTRGVGGYSHSDVVKVHGVKPGGTKAERTRVATPAQAENSYAMLVIWRSFMKELALRAAYSSDTHSFASTVCSTKLRIHLEILGSPALSRD